jgi:hypothetical protein
MVLKYNGDLNFMSNGYEVRWKTGFFDAMDDEVVLSSIGSWLLGMKTTFLVGVMMMTSLCVGGPAYQLVL